LSPNEKMVATDHNAEEEGEDHSSYEHLLFVGIYGDFIVDVSLPITDCHLVSQWIHGGTRMEIYPPEGHITRVFSTKSDLHNEVYFKSHDKFLGFPIQRKSFIFYKDLAAYGKHSAYGKIYHLQDGELIPYQPPPEKEPSPFWFKDLGLKETL